MNEFVVNGEKFFSNEQYLEIMARRNGNYSRKMEEAHERLKPSTNDALKLTAQNNDYNSIEATAARLILQGRGVKY